MDSSEPAVPAHPIVTPNNFGPAVNILNWMLIVTTSLVIITRFTFKLRISCFAGDDVFILLALLFSIGVCIATSVATTNGLGQHQNSLSPEQVASFQKATFASEIFYVLVLATSKLSIVFFLKIMTVKELLNRIRVAIGVIIICWGISSLFVVSFQCAAPDSWQILGSHCFHQEAFWTYHAVFNIMLEFTLMILPFAVIWQLQARISRKIAIMTSFGVRMFAIGAIIAQLMLTKQKSHSQDRIFHIWPVVIAGLFVQSLSIICSCIPYMQTFLGAIQSGMIRNDDLRRHGTTISGVYGTTITTSGHMLSKNTGNKSTKKSAQQSFGLRSISITKSWNVLGTASSEEPEQDKQIWDRESQASRSKMIVEPVIAERSA